MTKHMNLPLTARAAVLQALLLGSMNPVDLREHLKGCGLHVSNGSLYPAIQGLFDEGYLRIAEAGTWTVNGGEAEASYALTDRGFKRAMEIRGSLQALMALSKRPRGPGIESQSASHL